MMLVNKDGAVSFGFDCKLILVKGVGSQVGLSVS